ELLRAEVESPLTAASAPGADDICPGLAGKLGCHRTDYAGRTMHKNTLPRTKPAVIEQPLPCGQARHHERCANREFDVPRQRREVACFDGHILCQCAITRPIGEAEYALSYRQPRRTVAESGDYPGHLVARNRGCAVAAEAIHPGGGPGQFIP